VPQLRRLAAGFFTPEARIQLRVISYEIRGGRNATEEGIFFFLECLRLSSVDHHSTTALLRCAKALTKQHIIKT
jgi:hypothetical protein